MIGIVLIAHGRLGSEFFGAVEHVLGPQSQMVAVDVMPGDGISEKQQEVMRAIEKVRDPIGRDGVLILTDMRGGSPSNIAVKAVSGINAAVLAGINLPMLLTIAKAREHGALERVARLGVEAGAKYVDLITPITPLGPLNDG